LPVLNIKLSIINYQLSMLSFTDRRLSFTDFNGFLTLKTLGTEKVFSLLHPD